MLCRFKPNAVLLTSFNKTITRAKFTALPKPCRSRQIARPFHASKQLNSLFWSDTKHSPHRYLRSPYFGPYNGGRLVRWKKRIGEPFDFDEVIVEFKCHETIIPVKAIEPGVLLTQLANVNDIVGSNDDILSYQPTSYKHHIPPDQVGDSYVAKPALGHWTPEGIKPK